VNDVPVGDDATIDHLLVGPAGVFAVNAKNVSGQVWVGASGVRVNEHAPTMCGCWSTQPSERPACFRAS
jgi:hypothetical protein